MKQGKKAQRSGSILENQIRTAFEGLDYLILDYHKDYKGKEETFIGKNVLIKHFPYKNIYGSDGKSEFVAIRSDGEKFRIECKWQQSTGSVDEKYVGMYFSLLKCPEKNIICVIDGGGYRPEMREWLYNAAKTQWRQTVEEKHKNIKVFYLTEFIQWINKELDTL